MRECVLCAVVLLVKLLARKNLIKETPKPMKEAAGQFWVRSPPGLQLTGLRIRIGCEEKHPDPVCQPMPAQDDDCVRKDCPEKS